MAYLYFFRILTKSSSCYSRVKKIVFSKMFINKIFSNTGPMYKIVTFTFNLRSILMGARLHVSSGLMSKFFLFLSLTGFSSNVRQVILIQPHGRLDGDLAYDRFEPTTSCFGSQRAYHYDTHTPNNEDARWKQFFLKQCVIILRFT